MRAIHSWLLLPALLLVSCSGLPPEKVPLQPAHASLSLLIVSIRFAKITIPFPDRYAAKVHLAQLNAQGEPEMDHPLTSQYNEKQLVYFFNIPPGRYVMIGASYVAHGLRYDLRLSPEYSMRTVIEVKPGQCSFMGLVLLSREFKDWLSFALNVLKSLAVVLPPWTPWKTDVNASFKTVDRLVATEVSALSAAKEQLRGTPWVDAISERLKALGGPIPEPIMEGRWRKQPKPAVETARFSYMETLPWPKPTAIKGGLEWRHPKDYARIALRFVSQADPGFKSQEAYLKELKALGSPEDSHTVKEIRLGTRPAYQVVYTKYVYPQPYLTGSVETVYVTDTVLVPEEDGYYVLYYRARREYFRELEPEYLRFRSYLKFNLPKKE